MSELSSLPPPPSEQLSVGRDRTAAVAPSRHCLHQPSQQPVDEPRARLSRARRRVRAVLGAKPDVSCGFGKIRLAERSGAGRKGSGAAPFHNCQASISALKVPSDSDSDSTSVPCLCFLRDRLGLQTCQPHATAMTWCPASGRNATRDAARRASAAACVMLRTPSCTTAPLSVTAMLFRQDEATCSPRREASASQQRLMS
eukprot:1180023-Rhodomonas_salina.3